MIRPLFFAALLMAAPCTTFAQQTPLPDMTAIEQAWTQGDFVFVREGLQRLATEDGSALAQYRYGRVLLEGRGGPQDSAAAIGWLEKAVAQNSAEAATLLGQVFLSRGAARNPARAATLFAAAAARGDTQAQYFLGLLHLEGDGVAADPVAAFNWFLAAAETGNRNAQYELSKAYARGRGTEQNAAQALRWLEEAAGAGLPDAQYFLANAYESGRGAPQSDDQAQAWYRRAAENGQVLAQRALGTRYLLGTQGLEPDAGEALRWLRAAAEAGDAGAMSNLGMGYAQGAVLPRDDGLAVRWYQQASDRGLGRATLALARLVETGRGTNADPVAAFRLYKLAVGQGSDLAAQILGGRVLRGDPDTGMPPHDAVPWVMAVLEKTGSAEAQAWLAAQAAAGVRPAQADYGQWLLGQDGRTGDAVALMEQAAFGGHVPSQVRLGEAYTTGAGVALDYVRAHAWLNIAAASGHRKAGETRALLNDLMTPEQVAEAQSIAREFFAKSSALVPQTQQTITREAD